MIVNEQKNIKISLVCPGFYWGDAVGQSAWHYYLALQELGYTNIKAMGIRTDYDIIDFEKCETLADIKGSSWFNESDLVIYHFAAYNEVFDILAFPQKKGHHVVCFHNVTPKELVPEKFWEFIDRSFEQISLFQHADMIWADSRENMDELRTCGVQGVPIMEMPLAVDRPPVSTMHSKAGSPVELLCVGRFFPSKGITDVIDAVALAKEKTPARFLLRLVGNTDYSHQEYIEEVKARIRWHGLGEQVEFVGKVSEDTLLRVYKNAHIFVSASYHEGFCVPVIESLRAGMVPVTYSAGNLRWIANGLGRIVETGSIEQLGTALAETIDQVSQAMEKPGEPFLHLDKGVFSLDQFAEEALSYVKTLEYSRFKERLSDAILNLPPKKQGGNASGP